MSDKNEQKKGIKVISGDGSNLDISPVYEHIDAAKPKINEKYYCSRRKKSCQEKEKLESI